MASADTDAEQFTTDYISKQYYVVKLRGHDAYLSAATTYVGPTNVPLKHPNEASPRLFMTKAKADRSLKAWVHGSGNRSAAEYHALGVRVYEDFEICPTVIGVKHSDLI